ncbi:nuclear export protein Noc3 [Histoplasma capsulatum G186AR]|uniref:Nucleolar complex-associated protein 3 n=2 Tax=Ajellomyces capsulatus TaxID=5037 RepID=C0NW86_AJECG|nr:nuclear export protein Noc3 [Histoplasma capsulatum G186AR]EEH04191.1 nuclear export protein Noc3 [Histoplasma capsulatum G186AR]KAG5291141.1 nuclear export protein Noc3 [Histoplasma capsulatum]QSS68444.1 nuclear export protein Noc3 [Histoplasma capsulatum G186AR]
MATEHAFKRKRLSLSKDGDSYTPSTNGSSMKDFYSRAAEWNLEQDYERRPRKTSKRDKEKNRLPIKTAEGTIEHVSEPIVEDDSEDLFDSDEDDVEEQPEAEVVEKPKPYVPAKVQILEAKEELARIAELINEDPEEHTGLFKRLADMVSETSLPAVKKLALATQVAIYRDVIPGYRIRPLGEDDMTTNVSKDVRKLRNFEQSLLAGYQNTVKVLASFVKPQTKESVDAEGLKAVSINCACSLLIAVPHFNFRGELLKILVSQLGRRKVDDNFVKCRETIEKIFANDEDGIVSMEAVSLLSKMMKARDYRVHDSVLDTFLHLRLLSEFSLKGSKDTIDNHKSDETIKGKKPKMKREFRTKKERKLLKERNAVAKDMKEADALVSHEQRDKMQAEALKLVFGTYFRILKLRSPNLMGAVLEGLAKYAHLINQDFFGDLLEALKELLAQTATSDSSETVDPSDTINGPDSLEEVATRSITREALLCCITAFALLEGQDGSKAASTLHLDLSYFMTHLYQSLYPLSLHPEIEYNPNKSLYLPDPSSSLPEHAQTKTDNKVNFQTPTVLLLRCLQSTLLAKGTNAAPPVRVAGFTKRLMTASLQLPEKSSLALLSLLTRVAKQHGRKIAPLWNTEERRGDGVFNPLAETVEESNVFAGNVWEGELLRLHYCPKVREAAKEVENVVASVK